MAASEGPRRHGLGFAATTHTYGRPSVAISMDRRIGTGTGTGMHGRGGGEAGGRNQPWREQSARNVTMDSVS